MAKPVFRPSASIYPSCLLGLILLVSAPNGAYLFHPVASNGKNSFQKLASLQYTSLLPPSRSPRWSLQFSVAHESLETNASLVALKELAYITSKDPTATTKAQAILSNVEKEIVDTALLNVVLQVYAYSCSDGCEAAEALHASMCESGQSDTTSHTLVMEAWIRAGQYDKIEVLVDRLQEKEETVLPVEIYNKRLKLYGVQGSPEEAHALLQSMMRDKALPNPNPKSWIHVMHAYEKSSPQTRISEELEQEIKDYYAAQETDIQGYNELLQAMSQAKRYKEAESLFYHLLAESQAKNNPSIRPNTETFFHVMHAFRNRKESGVAFKMEKLLELQDALYEQDPSENLEMKGRNLLCAMTVISQTRNARKAAKVQTLLRQLEDLDDPTFELKLGVYKTLLRACALTPKSVEDDPEQKLEIFSIAVETLNEIRDSDTLSADGTAYGLFLRACNLMPASGKRDGVVQSVFSKCCAEGLTSEYVLREFSRVASKELQLKQLGGFLEDGIQPPTEWSRNV